MTKLEVKAQEAKELLEELGFTVSLNYEREPQGLLFADIHEFLTPVNNDTALYQRFKGLEITLMAVVTDETQRVIYRAIDLLGFDHNVYTTSTDNNTITIKMRGNYYD